MWSSCLLLPRQLLNKAHPEVLTLCEHLKLPGPGQRLTPAAKKKVADRVPAQDWSFIAEGDLDLFPGKSPERNGETSGIGYPASAANTSHSLSPWWCWGGSGHGCPGLAGCQGCLAQSCCACSRVSQRAV